MPASATRGELRTSAPAPQASCAIASNANAHWACLASECAPTAVAWIAPAPSEAMPAKASRPVVMRSPVVEKVVAAAASSSAGTFSAVMGGIPL